VVEKVAALKTADYFVERARRADFDALDRIMTGRVASRYGRRTQTRAARYRRNIGWERPLLTLSRHSGRARDSSATGGKPSVRF
jgi:hypothetical protein